MIYAQLDANNIVTGIHEGDVSNVDGIEIDSFDISKVGQHWNGTSFIDADENNIYAHVSLTDGDGMDPIGILNDGVDALHAVVTFRGGPSPDSDVITAITGLNRRITIRNTDGAVHDIVMVGFTNGVSEFHYSTEGAPGILQILESDFETLQVGETEYTIKLVGNSAFKVYRQL